MAMSQDAIGRWVDEEYRRIRKSGKFTLNSVDIWATDYAIAVDPGGYPSVAESKRAPGGPSWKDEGGTVFSEPKKRGRPRTRPIRPPRDQPSAFCRTCKTSPRYKHRTECMSCHKARMKATSAINATGRP